VAFAVLPALAYLAKVLVDMALAGRPTVTPPAVAMHQSITCLANGFIVTSLLWGAALAALLDGRGRLAALYLLVAAVFSFVGVMHSPFGDAEIAWPWDVVAKLRATGQLANARYQTPYHLTAMYVLMAGLVLALGGRGITSGDPDESKADTGDEIDHRINAG
jgi:AGZA family xanthine/uracil permease-like MFS transporter